MILLLSMLCSGLAAENLEKTQKKELEAQVKTMTAEAQSLERSGRLAEARIKYAESQALIEMKDVTDALKHLDEEIQKRVKNALNDSRKLYEAHKFREAALALDEAMKLQAFQPVLAYNLALCYHQLGERDKALEYLGKARSGTADPKQKQKLMQMVSFFTTGESGLSLNETDKDRVTRVNRLADSIGLEASLQDDAGEDEAGEEAALADPGALPSPPASRALLPANANPPGGPHSNTSAGHRSSLCNALGELKGTLATSPSATFNLANCAESNGRPAEAVRLLEKYLELAPTALDAGEVHVRIADLKSLLTLPGQNGVDVRRLYASAYGSLAERKYDRALADFTKAGELAPEFALTKWKLGLFYEAMGNIDRARENFIAYQKLDVRPGREG